MPRRGMAMIESALVTIVLNGTIVTSVLPARIARGHVVAPLMPIVVRLVSRVSYDAPTATIELERGGIRIVVPVAFVENDVPFVELRPVVVRLGGSATFDARSKTIDIVLRGADTVATPAPFDPQLPQPRASAVFTPAPPPATPRALESGAARPRRTAIPVVPSQPGSPIADPTSRRR